jgi:hypothetical protein
MSQTTRHCIAEDIILQFESCLCFVIIGVTVTQPKKLNGKDILLTLVKILPSSARKKHTIRGITTVTRNKYIYIYIRKKKKFPMFDSLRASKARPSRVLEST